MSTDVLKLPLDTLRRGQPVIVVDQAREGQIYLVAGAENVSAQLICQMVNFGRGIICAAMSEQRAKALGLPSMVEPRLQRGIDFTVSVEARQGVTTGISAEDRARTLRILATSTDARVDIVTPGHIFPIRAKNGGVLVRSDISEAAVDLMTLAGVSPVAALCHCLDDSGELRRNHSVPELAKSLGAPIVNISDIIQYRLTTEQIVEKVAEAKLPTLVAGEFRACCFRSHTDQAEHLALVKGDITSCDSNGEQTPVMVRVQAEHRLGDLLGLNGPSSLQRLRAAMAAIEKEGRGVLVYVRHPRKGLLTDQLVELQRGTTESSMRTLREHGIGAQILRSLGVKRIKLLSNSPRNIAGINAFQIEIVSQIRFDERFKV